MWQTWWLWTIVAYFCGSVPFAMLIARAKGVDLRQFGSGNPGATNVGRALGRRWGLLCFALDVAKGAAPVLAGGWAMGAADRPMGWLGQADLSHVQQWQWLAVAAGAIVGHIFTVWLKFRGGKGVATGLGAVLGVFPLLTLPGLAALLVWIITVKLWRYVSLSSMLAAVALPVGVLVDSLARGIPLSDRLPMLAVTAALGLLVVVRHRTNIARLLQGTESKLGERKDARPS